jgi:hypothetical protein
MDTIGKINEFCGELIAGGKPPGLGLTIQCEAMPERANVSKRGIDL